MLKREEGNLRYFFIVYSILIFVRSLATYNQHVGIQNSHIQPTDDIFNSNDPRLKEVRVLHFIHNDIDNIKRILLLLLCNIYKTKDIMLLSQFYMMKRMLSGKKEKNEQ